MNLEESGKVYTEWKIQKFSDRASYLGNKPFEVSEFSKNVLLNEGIQELLDLLIGVGGAVTAFNQANTALGVGDSTASSGVATSTGLLSTANTLFVQCSTGYPSRSAQTVTWRAVFSSAQANFNWREFAVRNSLTSTGRDRDLNRRVSNQGTKVAGQTWTLDLQLTVS